MDAHLLLTALPLFAAGLLIGTIAAMFGVGGGVLNVPIIYLLLTRAWGVPDGLAFKSALATSMFTMFFTQLAGGLGHFRNRNYIIGAVPWLAPGAIAGGVCGASAAMWLSGDLLKGIFGCLLLFLAWRMARGGAQDKNQQAAPAENNAAALLGIGFLTGGLGSLLGVGGGVIIIPFLVVLLGHSFHKAVGTSSILIIFTAAAAFARFMLGAPPAHLPFSVGYVNWLAAAGLAPGSMLGALLGVRLVMRINPAPLRAAFAVLIAAVALKLLGAFHALAHLLR